MPRRYYSLTCSHGQSGVRTSASACSVCGAPGHFECWSLGMHESMARYQYVYGMKPIGPHRHEADRILGALRATCSMCQGNGLLWPEDGGSWSACPVCEATGGSWICSAEEKEAARQRVLALHPDAGASSWNIRFLSGRLAHDLGSGEMMNL
jgi:hypothetical protein